MRQNERRGDEEAETIIYLLPLHNSLVEIRPKTKAPGAFSFRRASFATISIPYLVPRDSAIAFLQQLFSYRRKLCDIDAKQCAQLRRYSGLLIGLAH